MKMKISISFLVLLSGLFIRCNGQTTSKSSENNNCSKFIKKHNQSANKMMNDSAIYFINKSIKCNPQNTSYKFKKVNFLVQIEDYKKAIVLLDTLVDAKEPSFKMFKGTLKLKINDTDSKEVLKDTYKDYQKISNPTVNNLFYKFALDNYFNGKGYALSEIEKTKKTLSSDYEKQNIEAIEEFIKNDSKEEVLFKIFNIK